MRKSNTQKGITLVALIITIVVLLILAVVAIRVVQGDGIIGYARNAKYEQNIAKEKEKIALALSEWRIQKHTSSGDFKTFLESKFSNVIANEDETYTITIPESGAIYNVKEDGTIENSVGIFLNKTEIKLEVEDAEIQEELVAKLSNIEGTITWTTDNEEIVTLGTTEGNTTTLTVNKVAKGTANVTATCGEYTAICTIIVKDPIPVGIYVNYDVEYKDMYSLITYNATNGWRYLGKDTDGNRMLISTGIPMILHWTSTETGGYEKWWDTDISLMNCVRVANGLIKNFTDIPYQKVTAGITSTSTANTAIGLFEGTDKTIGEGGSVETYKSVGDAFLSTTKSNKIKKIRTLTVAELNDATSSARESDDIGFKDLTGIAIGLFDMYDLEGYTGNYHYWLATAYTGTGNVYQVHYSYNYINNHGNMSMGVRPVIVLSSGVELEDKDGDGILEII